MGKFLRPAIFASSVLAVIAIATILGVALTRKRNRSGADRALSPLVMTDCGPVAGRTVTVNTTSAIQKSCHEFINIPFAEPPVGKLRWKRPQLLDGTDPSKCWKGVLAADKDTVKMCSQPTADFSHVLGEEDCLYLTVRSPNLTGSLPVLVWIHGGGLFEGYGNKVGYSADAEFAVSMDVVAVNINYRLGIMGFLCMEEIWTTTEPRTYGNFGFLDQIAALQWVQRNIARFGGNPVSVTILGESSGGTSVLALASSPLAEDLFHKAVGTSGSSLFRYDHIQAAEINRRRFTDILACNQSTFEYRRTCLLGKSPRELVMATKWMVMHVLSDLLPNPIKPLPLLFAVKDPIVLPFDPGNPAEWSRKRKLVIGLGNMAEEIPDSEIDTWNAVYHVVKSHLDQFNESFTKNVFTLYNTSVAGRPKTPVEVLAAVKADILVTCPYNRLAGKLSERPLYEVYRFYVSHQPSSPVRDDDPASSLTYNVAYHTWDMVALFNFQRKKGVFIPADHDYALMHELRRMMKALMHDEVMSTCWPQYPNSSTDFINAPPWLVVSEQPIQAKQCEFWDRNGFQNYAWEN